MGPTGLSTSVGTAIVGAPVRRSPLVFLGVALVALALSSAPASAARTPAPIAGKGYRLVFNDDFNSFRTRVWTRRIWYDGAAPRHSIYARKGVLHLVSRRSQGNYHYITVTTLKSHSFRRGFFEARMRWTRGQGAWPGFWLLSTRHARNPAWPNINPFCANHGLLRALCYSAELDVFEGQGNEPRVFYGTLHRNSSGDYGVGDRQNSNNYHPQAKNLTTHFHRYGVLWTRHKLTWYLDGRRLMSTSPYDSTDQPMFLLLQMWDGGWNGDTNSSTPNSIQTRVDWVHVWQP
jgi:beta-glucanase (GH16 family)